MKGEDQSVSIRKRILWAGVTLLASALGLLGPAQSAEGWTRAGAVQGRLVSASAAVGQEQSLQFGLHLRMDDGWKTYWRTPGETGLAPAVDWAGSVNADGMRLAYPAPHRFEFAGIQSFGYKGEVVLPVAAAVVKPGDPVTLNAAVDVLVCKVECVPQKLQLSLTVPAGAMSPSSDASLLSKFQSQVPGDGSKHGLVLKDVELRSSSLVVRTAAKEPFSSPDAFLEGLPGSVSAGAPKVQLERGGLDAVFVFPLEQKASADSFDKKPVTVTLVDGARVGEFVQPVASSGASSLKTLALMLGFAFLGGLILNLMPCVLPVLSLKLLSVTHAGAGSPRKVRGTFLATAAGVVFSFLLLGAAAVALKSAGMTVGWGLQFQQPLFLVFMVVLVALFAANLWGFFEIPLPRFVADIAGSGGPGENSFAGNFVTGAFATLLATPCSAPFLGTAVGFALAGATSDIVAVFTALGLGMASPYLLVAAYPRMASWLPRPGAWMVKVRVALGFALAATGVWLLWVLQSQAGLYAALAVGLLMLLLWAVLGWQHRSSSSRAVPIALTAGLAVVVASFVAPALLTAPVQAPSQAAKYTWQPFDQAAIQREVAAGRTVFVDVTADWCVTCQVNKRVVLYQGQTANALFARNTVVPMQADWTSPNPAIGQYLAGFGKYGIPFNVVYGPAAPQGIVLSEVLTEAAVLEALAKASGTAQRL
jgi:suppressor for copper-sensitivity B